MGNRIQQIYQRQFNEKLKEGYEFKRKLEEEYWASRTNPYLKDLFKNENDKN